MQFLPEYIHNPWFCDAHNYGTTLGVLDQTATIRETMYLTRRDADQLTDDSILLTDIIILTDENISLPHSFLTG